ncbi:D-tyrosyl-tRNA(Tyr) deacylase [Arachis hypogaea]|nr:D-tyrosyl-tRNA(Tyr) deacylase [Arachis hypogaea]
MKPVLNVVPRVTVAVTAAPADGVVVSARSRTRGRKPLRGVTRRIRSKPLPLTVKAMRAVVQRVASASVEVEGRIVSEIGPGLVVLVGIHDSDSDADADYICRKVLNMRLFPNENTGKAWDHSVMQKKYQVLLVSQFTLYGFLKGNKPDFHVAMPPQKANPFYASLVDRFRNTYNSDAIKDGVFGAMMKVNLVNDGPVTMQLDSQSSKSATYSSRFTTTANSNHACILFRPECTEINFGPLKYGGGSTCTEHSDAQVSMRVVCQLGSVCSDMPGRLVLLSPFFTVYCSCLFMAGERGKEKLKVVEVKEDDPYHWVHDDVRTHSSLFTSVDSMADLRSLNFVKGGSNVAVEFLPCSDSDRVCKRRGDWGYFYMYTPCMIGGISSFECDVLTQLNCAPSQLHPNSWAFLRAFQCLMDFLSFRCSLSLFFSLFQAKGVRKGLWVCLSSFPGRSLFLLYKSSFKNFKSLFIKVRSVEAEYPFYLDDELFEKFPFYWCSEPSQILEAAERSDEEDSFLNFLVESFADGLCLSIPELLHLYDSGDNEGLKVYIGGRVPLLDPSCLQSFMKKKKEKDASVVGVQKDDGGPAAYSVAQPASSYKRRRDDIDKSVEVISEGDQEVAGGDKASQYPGDMLMTRRIIGSRLMCVGHTTELIGAEHKEAMDKASDIERSYKAKVMELEKSINDKDDVIVSVVAKAKESEEEVVRLRDQVRLLQVEIKESDVSKGKLTARVHELEEAGMEMFVSGFDRAVSQISLLAPDFDCDLLDATKIVIDGKLVMDGTVEEHDENAPPT